MTKEFIDFEIVINHSGVKVINSTFLSTIEKKPVGIMRFMTPKQDAAFYTNVDGTENAEKKLYCKDIQTNTIKDCARGHRHFQEDWMQMFHHILGQLCPKMVQRFLRSDDWESILESTDT